VLDTGTQQLLMYSGARWLRALNSIRHSLKRSLRVLVPVANANGRVVMVV